VGGGFFAEIVHEGHLSTRQFPRNSRTAQYELSPYRAQRDHDLVELLNFSCEGVAPIAGHLEHDFLFFLKLIA
jgi:hypothetical protein